MKRKFLHFLSLLLLMLCSTSAWAGVYTISFNGEDVASTSDYFTYSGNHNFNTKYTGTYGGITFKSGLKMEGSSIISFTTGGDATLTIVQSLTSNTTGYPKVSTDGTLVFTGSGDNRVDDTTDKVGVYTVDIEAGTHQITRTSEYGILYIKVEDKDASVVATPVISSKLGDSFGAATTVSISCSTADAAIYYTTDGSTPSTSSNLYSEAFTVNSACTVKAIATKNGMTASAVASANVAINKSRKIAYDFSGVTLTEGTAIANTTCEDGQTVILPLGRLYYVEGKTQTGWSDGTDTYALGQTITVNKDFTLVPVFADNTVALGDAETTVNWTFATAEGAPSAGIEGKSGYYAAQASINGTALDVIMKINAETGAGIEGTKGKWNTTSANNRAQVNKGTVFTIPAVKGMVITYTKTNGTFDTESATFAGEAGTVDGNNLTYTYNGDAKTIDIIDMKGGYYPAGLSAVYPKISSVDPEPTPEPAEWESYELVLNKAGLLTADEISSKEQVTFGIALDDNGKAIRVAADATNAIAVVSGNYHSDHGMNPFSMTAKVPGAVKITAGTCSYGTCTVTVNGTAVGEPVVGDNATTCWKNNPANVATGIYEGEAGEITITTGCYTPYIKIEKYVAPIDPTPIEPGDATYDNVEGTVTWAIGNETFGTATSAVADAISSTKVSVGLDLNATKGDAYADIAGSVPMVKYQPNTSNAGKVAADMIEYTVKMKKGVTFQPTSFVFDAVKEGTDGAYFSWSYTVDGVESDIIEYNDPKTQIRRNNNANPSAPLTHNETVTATAGQVVTLRFYISNVAYDKKMAIGNIKVNGIVNGTPEVRTFKDFKVDFRIKNGDQAYTVVTPADGLPEGVTVNPGSYNGGQHGAANPSVTVKVDGPVKFYIGSCQFGGHTVTVKDENNTTLATVDNNNGCENGYTTIEDCTYDKYVVYTYNNETPATLTLSVNGYCPFFIAEACEFIPSVDVKYYDVDGKTIIGVESIDGGSALAYKYGADDVTVADGKAFRGWFASTEPAAVKVKEGTPIAENLNLYAKATDIEIPTVGSIWTYELNKTYFYQEDHEGINIINGSFHDGQHGWQFGSNSTIEIPVAGKAVVNFSLCMYSGDSNTITLSETGESINAKVAADGASASFSYDGEATTLHFDINGGYVHNIKVFNVNEIPTKNAAGYYVLNSGDAAGLILTLATAQSGDKIFLPNGLYDLGATCLTAVPAGVSIIGQSQKDVIVKNTPLEEGIGVTATLMPGGDNYMQDFSIQCSSEKCATPAASRCVTIQDKATRNIFKNVSLLSGQDTYYSNGNEKQQGYFEDCYITGTVDYICGGGDIVFKNTTFYCNDRKGDVIVAPSTNANTKWGYVMMDCTVDGHANCDGNFNIGRDWQGSPAATWLNTTFKIMPTAAGYTKMSNSALVLRFHEFNSHKENGTEITGHNFDALVGGSTYNDQLYLTVEQADKYTLANIFADGVYTGISAWNPAADTEQAVVDNDNIEEDETYLIENAGNFVAIIKGSEFSNVTYRGMTIRKANARGGFGESIVISESTGICDRNVITNMSNAPIYNIAGQRVAAGTKGILIQNGVKMIVK